MYDLENSISFLNNLKVIKNDSNDSNNNFLVDLKFNFRVDKISEYIYKDKYYFDFIVLCNNIYNLFDSIDSKVVSDNNKVYEFYINKNFIDFFLKIYFEDNEDGKFCIDYNNLVINNNLVFNKYINNITFDKNKIVIEFKRDLKFNSLVEIRYKYYKEFDYYKSGEKIEFYNNDVIYYYNEVLKKIYRV